MNSWPRKFIVSPDVKLLKNYRFRTQRTSIFYNIMTKVINLACAKTKQIMIFPTLDFIWRLACLCYPGFFIKSTSAGEI